MRLRTALLAAALLLPTPLFAQITYYFTGQNFVYSSGPYSTSDFITGKFTVSAPLTDNLTTLAPISPTCFSFTDGVDTITNLTASVSDTFQVETGPTGSITESLSR